jgi:dTDP-4-amino-4,6-dideoxygalactose transaminase
MNVPFVDLKAQYQSIKEEMDTAIQNVINDAAFIKGKYLAAFEENFAKFVGVPYCVGVGNGTDAIYIALKALGIKEGDEVITAANTFIATSESITLAGARVVFVDCHPDTYNIDADKIEAKITDKTKAIVPVHLFGHPADMDPIMEIAKKHNLKIIEDCAQAHGARYKGKSIGTFGHLATFSFFPGKNLGAYGDGGAVVTSDEELAKNVRMIANHGRIDKFGHRFEGINSRLDGLQAAILDVKLKYLDQWNQRRRQVAEMYNEGLKDVADVPAVSNDVQHVYHLYVARVPDRDGIKKKLAEKGIASGIHYPTALPYLEAYNYLNHTPEDFPVAHKYQDLILSLPIHGSMRDDEVKYVIDELKNIL